MTAHTEEIRKRVEESVPIAPMNRMGRPEEIAGAVLFLCSGQASFVQGHALVVDGGYSIG
jgi:NAD(P)-dependent dehydrogenase (short-subunit alcohol dehydrogenase family)